MAVSLGEMLSIRNLFYYSFKNPDMVLALAAYVYASVQTPEHEFNGGFALLLLFADLWVAAAFSPSLSL